MALSIHFDTRIMCTVNHGCPDTKPNAESDAEGLPSFFQQLGQPDLAAPEEHPQDRPKPVTTWLLLLWVQHHWHQTSTPW